MVCGALGCLQIIRVNGRGDNDIFFINVLSDMKYYDKMFHVKQKMTKLRELMNVTSSTNIETIVSRETYKKLSIYKTTLLQWNRKTGLIQIDSFDDYDSRHVLDSLQLIQLIENLTHKIGFREPQEEEGIDNSNLLKNLQIIDIGSGSGFPGMVLAIAGYENITLCESNGKKCIFLEEVARLTSTPVKILHARAEQVLEKYDLVISRACADLDALLRLMKNVSRETTTVGLFHKGKTWRSELDHAQQHWSFDYNAHPSITQNDSVILEIWNLNPR